MSAEGLGPEGRAEATGPDGATGMDTAQPTRLASSTPLRVDIHDIHPYERNPRRECNPLYYELKQSIRDRGLDQALPITRRPDAAHYIIGAGGNTRLEILRELYAETGEERFRAIDCRYKPWQSEGEVLIAHLTENDLRAPLTFIERAHAVLDLEGLIETETGRRLSQAELSECLAERYGYRVSQTLISHMHYAVEVLEPVLPHALRGGLGKGPVERLRALERAIARFLESRARREETAAVWQWFLQCLAQYDCLDCRDFTPAEEELVSHLVQLTQEPMAWVRLDLEALLKGATAVRPYVMSPEREAQLHAPAAGVVPIRGRARRPALLAGSAGSGEAARPGPGEEVSMPAWTGASPGTDAAEPSGAQLMALPRARPDEPAGGPSAWRQDILALARRLAEPSALAEAIVALGHGVGFFMDLPPAPLVEAGAPVAEARAGRKRAALWWLLASLSEQFLHGTEALVQELGTTRLMALVTATGEAGGGAVSEILREHVGEPTLEALGRDLLAELTEAERRDLAALLAARCELQAACTRLGQASPWEV